MISSSKEVQTWQSVKFVARMLLLAFRCPIPIDGRTEPGSRTFGASRRSWTAARSAFTPAPAACVPARLPVLSDQDNRRITGSSLAEILFSFSSKHFSLFSAVLVWAAHSPTGKTDIYFWNFRFPWQEHSPALHSFPKRGWQWSKKGRTHSNVRFRPFLCSGLVSLSFSPWFFSPRPHADAECLHGACIREWKLAAQQLLHWI